MKTTPFDVQDYLKTPEERAAYLEAILEDGDTDLIASGLGDIARAFGASELARQTGLSREAIYKGLVARRQSDAGYDCADYQGARVAVDGGRRRGRRDRSHSAAA